MSLIMLYIRFVDYVMIADWLVINMNTVGDIRGHLLAKRGISKIKYI